jgi:hypothetical protein
MEYPQKHFQEKIDGDNRNERKKRRSAIISSSCELLLVPESVKLNIFLLMAPLDSSLMTNVHWKLMTSDDPGVLLKEERMGSSQCQNCSSLLFHLRHILSLERQLLHARN